MLDATKHRPDVDTIYVVNIDTTVLGEQIKRIGKTFADAVDNGNMTIATIDPTQSQLASVEFQSSNLVLTDSEMLVLVRQLRELLFKPIQFDIDAGKLAVSREMSQPSSALNQTAYAVADLPA